MFFGISDYGAFVAAIVLFLAIPGPGNLALITSTGKGGIRGGLAATLGVIAGDQVLLWAAVAGVSGALLAQTTGFASLDVFEMHRSADVMLMLVIGGTGWLWGGVFGAIVFKVMYDILSSITPQYWTFWLGLFLVVLVQVGRERLLRPWTWFGSRKGGAR